MRKFVLCIFLLTVTAAAVMCFANTGTSGKYAGSGEAAEAVLVQEQPVNTGDPIDVFYSPMDRRSAEKIVEAYDKFVRSKTGDAGSIGEAYKKFFADREARIDSVYALEMFTPDSIYIDRLMYDFITRRLEFSFLKPLYSASKFWYYGVEMNYLAPIIYDISHGNRPWQMAFESVRESGDFSLLRWSLFTMHNNINYDNKAERFFVAIAYMEPYLKHKSFVLLRDSK